MARIDEAILAFDNKRKLSHDLRHIKVKGATTERRPSILTQMHHGYGKTFTVPSIVTKIYQSACKDRFQ